MPLFSSIARAFGFGSADDPVEDTPSSEGTPAPCAEGSREVSAASSVSSPGEFPLEFFDSVLEVFNNAQPDFIRECIDRNAQRRYLLDQLGQSFADYLASERARLEESVGGDMATECRELRSRLADAEERVRLCGEKVEEAEQHRLSAERQKRALSEKLHDMEHRVGELETEKEQLNLDKRRLAEQLKTAEAAAETAPPVESDESASLRTRLSQANFINAQLKEEVERLKKESTDTAELYKSRMAMSDKMLSDLRNTNNRSAHELKQLHEETDNLRRRLEESERERTRLEEKVAADATAITDAAEREVALNASLEEARREVEELKSAAREGAGMEEIPAKPRRKRKPRPKISAIDETIDSTEWLVAAPPQTKGKDPAPAPDPDFGYQEPSRKTPPANDAQMLLF